MFERFTDRARRVVVLAQEEARLLTHQHVGTEHLLLGLLREENGLAARSLVSLGVSAGAVRDRLSPGAGPPGSAFPGSGTPASGAAGSGAAGSGAAGSGAAGSGAAGSGAAERVTARSGHIPFTPEAKRTLELALREALQLGHDYIGTEHVLLGLVSTTDCRAVQILAELGHDPRAVRQRVLALAPSPVASGDRHAAARAELRAEDETAVRLESLSRRLASLERWVGLSPELADLDEQLTRVRRDKESAIDSQDFRAAEMLSDSETEIMGERDRRARQVAASTSLAEEVAALRTEVGRLRDVLRRHGIDPAS